MKPNGSVPMFGDFKITFKLNLEIDPYLLPRIEDIFAQYNKGELYSKVDLSQAYTQLASVLDENSQKLCNISIHKSVFAYKRLPYGVASAQGIQ